MPVTMVKSRYVAVRTPFGDYVVFDKHVTSPVAQKIHSHTVARKLAALLAIFDALDVGQLEHLAETLDADEVSARLGVQRG